MVQETNEKIICKREKKKKKKTRLNFVKKKPIGPTVQEFLTEYNVGVFSRKLVDNIYRGLCNKWKNLLQKKKKLG